MSKSIQESILNVLRGNDIPENGIDTLELSKRVIGVNGTQKDVNPALYKLLSEGKITKVLIPNKSRPQWIISM